MATIPAADYGLIRGSSTLSIDFPDELQDPEVELIEQEIYFSTPYGDSPSFQYMCIRNTKGDKRYVLSCKMHGWRYNVSRADASRQVFWVLREAGVSRVLAEGGVGAMNHLLNPRDIVLPHDYMDFSVRKDVGLEGQYLLVMREALCPEMRKTLQDVCTRGWDQGRIFDRGIYVNTDGRHFESPAEINAYRIAGGDIVGQSICPEVYLAREIGACYAGMYIVVNYAEGIITPWEHEELADIYYHESLHLANLMLTTLKNIPEEKACHCSELRKETLLKEIYNKEERHGK